MKIAIQGEAGSFHDVAARQYFPNEKIELVPCSTFDLTVNTVKEGIAEFAIMAIENARAGSILYNYTLIRESGLKVLGEHDMRIRQNLMALPGQTLKDITEIRSHPIAFAQCMTFLNDLHGVTIIESDDTAGSARYIKENSLKGSAAIGAYIAAELYGLEIIAPGIETYKQNYTRFLIVGSKTRGNRNGNKASLCFSLKHHPGSLAGVLSRLAEMKINLSKIQSVPRLNGGWEYMFYIDLELPANSNIELVENELIEFTTDLEILGVYNKGDKLYES